MEELDPLEWKICGDCEEFGVTIGDCEGSEVVAIGAKMEMTESDAEEREDEDERSPDHSANDTMIETMTEC